MMSRVVLCVIALLALAASTACAQDYYWHSLYSADGYLMYGAESVGSTLAQSIMPSLSSPSPLTDTEGEYNDEAFQILVPQGTHLQIRVGTLPWKDTYAQTMAQAGHGFVGPDFYDFDASGGEMQVWVNCYSEDWGAMMDARTFLYLTVFSCSGTAGWGIQASNSNDGGTYNDAFYNGVQKNDREYQVRIFTDAVPEPTALAALAGSLGCLGAFARRRRS
jgi:hypothetical protein